MQAPLPIKVALFASGSGTNAQKIFEYFKDCKEIQIAMLLSNNSDAFALTRAQSFGIPTRVFTKSEFNDPDGIVRELINAGIQWIVLAGFLWLIPLHLIKAFPSSMLNIHPALLPKFGGKGMYGMKVHEAVKNTGETKTGITIHKVNEEYDKGEIVFQGFCDVVPEDTPETIAQKVHELEYLHFPSVIEQQIKLSL